MKMRFVAAAFLALAVFFGGCAAKDFGSESRILAVEIVRSGSLYVTDGRVHRDEDGLLVTGTLRRPHEVQIPGHLLVEVRGPEGELVGRQRQAVPGLASNRKGVIDFPFLVRLDILPPAGSTVRLGYHGPHLNRCGS